ncbi:MAG: hypothetical protein ACI9W6_002869 [Motiliproteus sp.]|jgi:hypothetical protein
MRVRLLIIDINDKLQGFNFEAVVFRIEANHEN